MLKKYPIWRGFDIFFQKSLIGQLLVDNFLESLLAKILYGNSVNLEFAGQQK